MARVRELRRGAERAVTVHEGCEARHGFAFGAHYDPDNAFFGALLAHNEERVRTGYPTHRHSEVDLVTWVVGGALRHADSLGHDHDLAPGHAQVLAAGTGVEHSEYGPAHFVQAWLVPDAVSPPALHRLDAGPALAAGRPVLVAAGPTTRGAEPADDEPTTTTPPLPPLLPLRRADTAFWAARLAAGARWTLPTARFVHVYVARGRAATPAGELGEGDELRLTDEPAHELVSDGAEVLVWAMAGDLRG